MSHQDAVAQKAGSFLCDILIKRGFNNICVCNVVNSRRAGIDVSLRIDECAVFIDDNAVNGF